MANKVINKKYNLSKIEAEFTLPELLDVWKKAAIAESSTRKNAFKSLANFKVWWKNYLEVVEYNDKVDCVAAELEKIENKTDAQKDWLDEKDRIIDQLYDCFKDLKPIGEMMHENKKQVFEYLSDPELKKYEVKIKQHFFWNLGHVGTKEAENLLDDFDCIYPFRDLYDDIRKNNSVPDVYDRKGNKVPGDTTWQKAFNSDDRYVRKQTYISYWSAYSRNMPVLFDICKFLAKFLNTKAKARNYSSWIDQKVQSWYEISLENYQYIMDQCVKFVEINKKYMAYNSKLIIDAYGLYEYAPWDEWIEIKDTKDSITIGQAKQLVLDGMACLGEEYVDKVKLCYKNNIINWKHDPDGKDENYCMAVKNTYDENVICFNWGGNSLCTVSLAHELGHNIRNKFLKENNEINNWTNRLTAEIPSVVNSILMSLYLIKKFKEENRPKEQLYGIYKDFIEYMVYCINFMGLKSHYCQCFTKYANKEPKLKWNDMPEMYFDLRKKYYGMSESTYNKAKKTPYSLQKLKCFDEFFYFADNWGNSISYYVGAIVGLPLAWKIFNGDNKALSKYYKFLKSGTSLDPVKTIKDTLDINLLKPEVYTEAKKVLSDIVNQFTKDIKI